MLEKLYFSIMEMAKGLTKERSHLNLELLMSPMLPVKLPRKIQIHTAAEKALIHIIKSLTNLQMDQTKRAKLHFPYSLKELLFSSTTVVPLGTSTYKILVKAKCCICLCVLLKHSHIKYQNDKFTAKLSHSYKLVSSCIFFCTIPKTK